MRGFIAKTQVCFQNNWFQPYFGSEYMLHVHLVTQNRYFPQKNQNLYFVWSPCFLFTLVNRMWGSKMIQNNPIEKRIPRKRIISTIFEYSILYNKNTSTVYIKIQVSYKKCCLISNNCFIISLLELNMSIWMYIKLIN